MGRTPLTPKGIGDFVFVIVVLVPGFGANAPHAERHWRQYLESCLGSLSVSGRTPLTPKGIGDRKGVFSTPVVKLARGERPSRRKALETPSPNPNVFARVLGRTPLAPKGIGDALLGPHPCRLWRSGRTPLAPKGIGDSSLRVELESILSWGERPSRRKASRKVNNIQIIYVIYP